MLILWIIILVVVIGYVVIRFNPAFGSRIKTSDQQHIIKSPNFRDGKFQNPVETRMQVDHLPFLKLFKEFLSNKGNRVPTNVIPTNPIDKTKYHKGTDDVKICWLGHSTMLIEIEGKLVLTDPVFCKRPSPFQFIGSKAFPYTVIYSLKDLPEIDLVLISHDHYDHLDHRVIRQLSSKKVNFVTPLGVGNHLTTWGISPNQITELDWWDEFQFSKEIKLAATPARHFTGRGLNNRFSTLWASWVISGANHQVFFGADSGYFPGFKTIGEKYGPFDIAMLECGQYSQYWPYIHMAPEQTYQAAKELKTKVLLPIHWGKFKLSIHPWTEPMERLLAANNSGELRITTPEIGETIELSSPLPSKKWWRHINQH
ncbi:MAG TPA: MBL fold metallo-hydrolase [Sunxiuqinia sp.]|nr:MBL fold metallo-hydrolase [Sunxiuqinia sp.]